MGSSVRQAVLSLLATAGVALAGPPGGDPTPAPVPGEVAAACPAEAQPDWSDASATEKRDRLRRCAVLHPAPADAPLPPGVQIAPTPLAPWPYDTRVAVQVTGGIFGAIAFTVVLAPLAVAIRNDAAEAATWVTASLTLGSLAVAGVVYGVGQLGRGGGRFWPTLGGAAVGVLAAVGCVTAGYAIERMFNSGDMAGLLGIVIGGAIGLPLAGIGATVGYELSVPDTAPTVSLVPRSGGATLAVTGRF